MEKDTRIQLYPIDLIITHGASFHSFVPSLGMLGMALPSPGMLFSGLNSDGLFNNSRGYNLNLDSPRDAPGGLDWPSG